MPDEKTFIIGNGKLAKIGDDVWDSGVATCKKQTIFGARTWGGKELLSVTDRYSALSSELFLTRREAIQAHRCDSKNCDNPLCRHLTAIDALLALTLSKEAKS